MNILTEVIQGLLTRKEGFLLHASASNVRGKAVLFLGPSGTGKSTIVSLLKNLYPSLADDTVIVKKDKNSFFFYHSPVIDKNFHIAKDKKRYVIDKVFFLYKANYFKIVKIENKENIINNFMRQSIIINNRMDCIKNMFYFIRNFNGFYLLYFAKNKKILSFF